ncbi:MAG TPA: hypothetical protein P5256_18330 [Beijerinckiaceae bacterium]|jgi:hypothetical protein|nr:hypothetical protein [Hyphomicrobiales bacterium]MCO5085997.1 hypothetical protein [Methylobacteriaceae bacterium]HRY05095.1 hypothetical protein [Beijerinckiaceae bacterium]
MTRSTITTVALALYDVSGRETLFPVAAFGIRAEAEAFAPVALAAFKQDRDAYVACALPIFQDRLVPNSREAAKAAAAPIVARWEAFGLTNSDFIQTCGATPTPGYAIRVINAPVHASAEAAAHELLPCNQDAMEAACS